MEEITNYWKWSSLLEVWKELTERSEDIVNMHLTTYVDDKLLSMLFKQEVDSERFELVSNKR